MKNITVSVSDKAYTAARTWAAANCTSVSAAVQAYIEVLPRTKSSPESLDCINRVRQQARARDRAARKEAQNLLSAVSQLKSPGILSVLRFFSKTAQKLRGSESPQQNQ